MRYVSHVAGVVFLPLALIACATKGKDTSTSTDEIPVTTKSADAREAFLEGRALFENLRLPEAREHYLRAVELDPSFALAQLAMANTSPTANEFWDSLGKAVEVSGEVSDGERDLILAAEAGAKGDPEAQEAYLRRIVEAYPEDARAHSVMGGFYFGRQDWSRAAEHYEKAIELSPDFAQPYNQLGYAHRFLANYERAEEVFRRYIELIPDEPNPYDSYAELLMKLGRYKESIRNYEEALERNPKFVASYVGIGNNQIFLGEYEEARRTFTDLSKVARNDGERRLALLWTANSYLHENQTEQALRTLSARMGIAEESGDLPSVAGDLVLIGNVLLESGRPMEAAKRYSKALEINAKADIPEANKENFRRNQLYREARVLLAQGDPDAAAAKGAEYGGQVAKRGIAFEIHLHHELLGRVALARGEYDVALHELQQANLQSPQVLYLLARAHESLGHQGEARKAYERAAKFNGLAFSYAYVRRAAEEHLARG